MRENKLTGTQLNYLLLCPPSRGSSRMASRWSVRTRMGNWASPSGGDLGREKKKINL